MARSRAAAALGPRRTPQTPADPQAAPLALPHKIEAALGDMRSNARRGKLSVPLHKPVWISSVMNANVAVREPQIQPCGEELTRINESLQARERLLSASASASRLLLEAPDVRAAIPRVLGIIGEAAHVDRVNVMETRTGPHGEPLLVVVSEWVAARSDAESGRRQRVLLR